MSEGVATTCDLCGRLVVPRQKKCVCGAVIRNDPPAESTDVSRFDYGAILPWVPLAGALILTRWTFDPATLVYTSAPAFKLYAITAIACAAIAMLASDRARKLNSATTPLQLPGLPDFAGLTPLSWFLVTLLLWPLALPAFLYVHYRAQSPGRLFFGLATTLAFITLFLYVWLVIGRSSPEGNSAPPDAKPIPAKYVEMKQAAQNLPATSPHPAATISPAPAQPAPSAAAAIATPAAPTATPYIPPPPPANHQVITPIPVMPQQTAHSDNNSANSGGGSSSSPGEGISILRRPK